MTSKYVVAFDGGEASKRALDFALGKAEATGASLLVVHVLEWSPYSFLTPEELEERHKRRTEELERAEKAIMEPLKSAMTGSKVKVETVIKYGHVAETLCKIAEETGATQMFVGRMGDKGVMARVFGSVAGSLAQAAPVPCTIVP